jgi:hypothetical protein
VAATGITGQPLRGSALQKARLALAARIRDRKALFTPAHIPDYTNPPKADPAHRGDHMTGSSMEHGVANADAGNAVSLFDDMRSLYAQGHIVRGLPADRIEAVEREVHASAWREGLTVTREGREVLYPMLASVRTLTSAFEQHLARHLPNIVTAWNKILTAYRGNQEIRRFLAVPASLRGWVDATPPETRRVDFCRFDMVGGSIGTARIVEFNANCPGGVLFTGAFRRIWASFPEIKELFGRWGIAHDTLHEREWFAKLLFSSTGAAGGDTVALFHQAGGNTLEIRKMRTILEAEGCRVIVTHPGADDWQYADARSAYLKYGVQAALADMSGWKPFLERAVSGDLAIVNPLAGRWIGDNKLCLAVMSDLRFRGLFSPAETEAIDRLIPFSRKAGDGIGGHELLEDRRAWIIKGPYDTQGRSVYVGAETDEALWPETVAAALRNGWLVQEAVEPCRVHWDGKPAYQDLSVVWLRGSFGGYTSRISENFKVNVAQGGGRQMVFGNTGISWTAASTCTAVTPAPVWLAGGQP